MSVLILGGSSLIAKCTAENFAAHGHNVIFAGRHTDELDKLAKDFEIRYKNKTYTLYFDAIDYSSHEKFLQEALKLLPDLDNVLIAFGYLGEQETANHDFVEARKSLETNFVGAVSITNHISDYFEKEKKGTIIIISSVAGDRGRQSNYIYGSAKAGLTAYTSGLRNRLFKSGVHVLTVKPGFVDTPMTYGMKTPKLLTASPKTVGRLIYKAVLKKKNVIYTPFYWKYIMKIVKSIPESIFKRLKT